MSEDLFGDPVVAAVGRIVRTACGQANGSVASSTDDIRDLWATVESALKLRGPSGDTGLRDRLIDCAVVCEQLLEITDRGSGGGLTEAARLWRRMYSLGLKARKLVGG